MTKHKKTDLIEALIKANVPLTGDELVADLEKLVADHQIVMPEPPAAPEGTSATVYTHGGGIVRTYTRELHGDAFLDNAKEMSAQHPGSHIDVR